MGGFNTYPALDIKQPESPLDRVSKLNSLLGAQQQLQMGAVELDNARQQQLESQTLRTLFQKNAGDLGKTISDAAASGKVSPQTLTKLQADHLKMQTDLATKEEKDLKNALDSGNLFAGALDAVKQMPVEKRAEGVKSQLAILANKGINVAGVAKSVQGLPDLSDETINGLEASLIGHNKAVEQEMKRRDTAAAELNAKARMANANKPPAEISDIADYAKTYLSAKNLPDTPSNQLLARNAYYKSKQPFGAQKIQIEQQRTDIAEQAAGRKDTDFIDKTYVKPANDVEKSYQMFMEAYKNRNNAKTGAESMLALSTHLATTFGNVKGSRVTKDMIEHHLGARNIGDSALVAVQKLTNGDVLSPNQWDAFKGLISNSRNLTWQTTQKEAARRNVDVSGSLPADLKGSGTAAPTTIRARDAQGKLHEAPAGTKLPAGWTLEK